MEGSVQNHGLTTPTNMLLAEPHNQSGRFEEDKIVISSMPISRAELASIHIQATFGRHGLIVVYALM
jgi:hypothetical protein